MIQEIRDQAATKTTNSDSPNRNVQLCSRIESTDHFAYRRLVSSMSSSSRSDGDNSIFDDEELWQIGIRCRELRREKDSLKDSQSQSYDLVRMLEVHVKSLSEAHLQDRKHIQKLERELSGCIQKIDDLQDQLSSKNAEMYCLGEHVHELELKLADMEYLRAKVSQLREELSRSESEHFLLLQQLEGKEIELQHSASCIEKMEESISMLTLDSQCEIESLKLEIMTLDQTRIEAERVQEETAQEREKMSGMIRELETQVHNAEDVIEHLEKENKELKENLITSERNSELLAQNVEKWLEDKEKSQHNAQLNSSEPTSKSIIIKEISHYEEVLGPISANPAITLAADSRLKEQIDSMSHQIRAYEVIVKQLKEELRDEKLKAKEEAEDLAQEMAELRYQMTELLEEESKRRASIEQASLQRISELEAQIQRERGNYVHAIKP